MISTASVSRVTCWLWLSSGQQFTKLCPILSICDSWPFLYTLNKLGLVYFCRISVFWYSVGKKYPAHVEFLSSSVLCAQMACEFVLQLGILICCRKKPTIIWRILLSIYRGNKRDCGYAWWCKLSRVRANFHSRLFFFLLVMTERTIWRKTTTHQASRSEKKKRSLDRFQGPFYRNQCTPGRGGKPRDMDGMMGSVVWDMTQGRYCWWLNSPILDR